MLFRAALPLLSFLSPTLEAAPTAKRATLRNTTFMGSHDSAFFSSKSLALARDQEIDVSTQLAHLNNGVIHFCHTSCGLFNGGAVLAYLQTVKTWLDANPDEVLTLLFTNPEGLSLSDHTSDALSTTTGIAALAYVPPQTPMPQSAWPTLGSLIDAGTRVVVFLDARADGSDGGVVPYILPEFTMVRILNTSSTFGMLLSDPGATGTTNGAASVLADARGCVPLSQGNRLPNFVLMDFVNLGQGMEAVDQLNGFS
ncbi:PLC-like phosphodiesterase [Mycena pura]|uniref:PLC-like phosphodiesterase n=1 Tax=Mycena pura TaxID=153505 RepID=A0AAD6VHT2_9AGAR|nr:PLC-like phosphodiesterase [Mycena pura]